MTLPQAIELCAILVFLGLFICLFLGLTVCND